MSRLGPTAFVSFLLLSAGPAAAQDAATAWEPLGAIPVDQAGTGRRGYVLPGDDATVTAAGGDRIALHLVAANDFYREQAAGMLITERAEAHTVALEYARGFAIGGFPRFEIGAQAQFHESDGGFLNGFIIGVENAWVSATGVLSAANPLRSATAAPLPPGTMVARAGAPTYVAPGSSSAFGDVYAFAKIQLVDPAPSPWATRVAARVGVNIPGAATFSEGTIAGVGVSVDQTIADHLALHGDVRTNLIFETQSAIGLPLRRSVIAFSAGPELRLTRHTSIGAQYDGGSTPYLPTGTEAFDANYGDITIAVSHRFQVGGRRLLAQLYGRENLNLPFSIRPNLDPDFAVGLKTTIY